MVQAAKPDLELILANSKTHIPDEHKQRVYELLCELTEKSDKLFGTIIVLGYVPPQSFQKYDADPMKTDYFKNNTANIYDPGVEERLTKAIYQDGATLMDPEGNILHSGYNLIYKGCKDIWMQLHAPHEGYVWQRFGFVEEVGTRHTSAISFSFRLPTSTVFIKSKSSGIIRVFEKGRIIYSQIKKEIWVPGEALTPEEHPIHETAKVISS
ncbi:hypothetical protein KY331_03730 [Candidatus Woesearchaeota archaeon]|nr:hypothetical protein [Candidatus Woesearchaeota archaeon]